MSNQTCENQLQRSFGKRENYENADAEETEGESTWRLNAALAGEPFKHCSAFTTLVMEERCFRLDFRSPCLETVCVEFGVVAQAEQCRFRFRGYAQLQAKEFL